MWKQPYTYKEGSVISIGLLVTGGLLQVAVGPLDWIVFMWPGNILALAFCCYCWQSSMPCGHMSISSGL